MKDDLWVHVGPKVKILIWWLKNVHKLTGHLGKFVQYEINDLCRPGFYVPDLSNSSRTVHKFVQVVSETSSLDGRSNKILTVPTAICCSRWEFLAELAFSLPWYGRRRWYYVDTDGSRLPIRELITKWCICVLCRIFIGFYNLVPSVSR